MKEKLKKSRKSKDIIEIFGFHAVQAALQNTKRIHQKLIISSNLQDKFKKLEHRVKQINSIPNQKFNKIYGNENNHQGVILKTSKLKQPSIDEVILKYKEKQNAIVIMLDQVTDPQNIGSIMRSCATFNCHSIIVAKDNAPDITSAMAKAASGALEIVNYVKITNLSRAILKFKKNNFWVVGFDSNSNDLVNNIRLPKKCLLIFGAEDKGLRKLTIKECDQILKIPINSNNQFGIESLNVSHACTIALYEYFKIFN